MSKKVSPKEAAAVLIMIELSTMWTCKSEVLKMLMDNRLELFDGSELEETLRHFNDWEDKCKKPIAEYLEGCGIFITPNETLHISRSNNE